MNTLSIKLNSNCCNSNNLNFLKILQESYFLKSELYQCPKCDLLWIKKEKFNYIDYTKNKNVSSIEIWYIPMKETELEIETKTNYIYTKIIFNDLE